MSTADLAARWIAAAAAVRHGRALRDAEPLADLACIPMYWAANTRATVLAGRLPKQKDAPVTDPSTGHDQAPGVSEAGPYRTKSGRILTAHELDALAAEAERGYPLEQLEAAAGCGKRRRRPDERPQA